MYACNIRQYLIRQKHFLLYFTKYFSCQRFVLHDNYYECEVNIFTVRIDAS